MFKLIRDKIPELVKKEGQVLNYATAENDELYVILLKNKLIEEVQEFINSGDILELVDVETVLQTLLKVAKVPEEKFKAAYAAKLETNGAFDKKLIGFFPDPVDTSKGEK